MVSINCPGVFNGRVGRVIKSEHCKYGDSVYVDLHYDTPEPLSQIFAAEVCGAERQGAECGLQAEDGVCLHVMERSARCEERYGKGTRGVFRDVRFGGSRIRPEGNKEKKGWCLY